MITPEVLNLFSFVFRIGYLTQCTPYEWDAKKRELVEPKPLLLRRWYWQLLNISMGVTFAFVSLIREGLHADMKITKMLIMFVYIGDGSILFSLMATGARMRVDLREAMNQLLKVDFLLQEKYLSRGKKARAAGRAKRHMQLMAIVLYAGYSVPLLQASLFVAGVEPFHYYIKRLLPEAAVKWVYFTLFLYEFQLLLCCWNTSMILLLVGAMYIQSTRFWLDQCRPDYNSNTTTRTKYIDISTPHSGFPGITQAYIWKARMAKAMYIFRIQQFFNGYINLLVRNTITAPIKLSTLCMITVGSFICVRYYSVIPTFAYFAILIGVTIMIAVITWFYSTLSSINRAYEDFCSMWRKHPATDIGMRQFIRSCKPIRIEVGPLYYFHNESPLQFLKAATNNVILLLQAM